MSLKTIFRALVAAALLSAAAVAGVRAQTGNGAVRGTVYDSIAQAPLRDAAVFLWNTPYKAVSNADGEFLIPNVPQGPYTLLFFHTKLGEMGISPGPMPIEVTADDTVDVSLATPSRFTMRVSRCLMEDRPAGAGAIAGHVDDGRSGMGMPHAHVTLSWAAENGSRPQQLDLDADAEGWYETCDAPSGTPISATAKFLDRKGLRREVTVPPGGAKQVSFDLWRLDNAKITGHIIDATSGDGVTDAEVWLRGTDFHTVTGSAGEFALGEVPPGTYMLFARHLVYGTKRDTLVVPSGHDLSVDMRVDTRAIEIAPLTVTAESVPVTRRAMGGLTIPRTDIDKVRGRVRDVADVLQLLQTPGVLIRRRADNSLCVGYTSGQVRMYNNTSGGCVSMTVYINDVRATNTDLALQMPPDAIDRIVIFRPLEAGALFGADASNGVIVIYTHNR